MPDKRDFSGVSRTLSELSRSIMAPKPSPPVTNVTENYASEFHKRLVKWINAFDSSLNEQHEVGIRLVSFGQAVTFHLENLGYWNPSLISFSGVTDSGEPVELIQHVSQISILLMTLPRRDPEKPKQPIGFQSVHQEASDSKDGFEQTET